jgi:hypothetical protein
MDSFYALSSGRAVPEYSDESLTGCWFESRQYSRFIVTRGSANRTSFVRIDEFLPYIARRVAIAFGYSNARRENETRLLETRAPSSNIRSAVGASLQSFLAGRDRDRPDRPRIKTQDFAIQGWSVRTWPIVIDNPADLGGSSLSGSAFFPCACGILLLRKQKIRGSPTASIA